MQLSLFDSPADAEIPLHEFFEAYMDCRRNKRSTANAIAFEVDYEQHLVALHQQVNDGSYIPRRSIAFIVQKPVQREIFAADFRDRVIHHLIINKLNPLFEKLFIYDSYACRKGKGTLFGIRRLNRFIRQCSHNYTQDCYVLKLDIQGFFMHIDRQILYNRLERFVRERYHKADKNILIELIHTIVFSDPTAHCCIKGGVYSWKGLPDNKSLFCSPSGSGLPIGNLSSQVFANFYMNEFDHFVKNELEIRYYGRYVDDFVCVHPDKEYLKRIVASIRHYLFHQLGLTLHPQKIYLQHYSRGVKYLGAVIKPYRMYISNRTMGNFYDAVHFQNSLLVDGHIPTDSEQNQFQSRLNSYLGFVRHYRSYRYRTRIVGHVSNQWWQYMAVSNQCRKFVKSDWISPPDFQW